MKNIILIGTGSGIGKATLQLLSKQYSVTALTRTVDGSTAANPNIIPFNVLTDDLSILSFPDVVDGLVYFPGSINLKPFHRLSTEDFKDDFEINVLGAIRVIQHLLPMLKRSAGASVVLFSTVATALGMPFHASIAVAKSAVEGLVKSLAAEYAAGGIRFNAIAPSITDTPLAAKILSTEEKKQAAAERHPLKKVGDANDIAALTAFLLSDNAQWITGQVLRVDGGMSQVKL